MLSSRRLYTHPYRKWWTYMQKYWIYITNTFIYLQIDFECQGTHFLWATLTPRWWSFRFYSYPADSWFTLQLLLYFFTAYKATLWCTSFAWKITTKCYREQWINISKHLLIHHDSPASTGVVSSVMSLPYKQSPASNRRMSRAPRPASFTGCTDNNLLANSIALSEGTDTLSTD